MTDDSVMSLKLRPVNVKVPFLLQASLVKVCERGCRIESMIESIDLENSVTSTIENCDTCKTCSKAHLPFCVDLIVFFFAACDASYHTQAERDACMEGCKFQVPFSKLRKQEVHHLKMKVSFQF